MSEAEGLAQSVETTTFPEHEAFSSEYDGLHVRLLLGDKALDPDNDKLPEVDKTQIKDFEERRGKYEIFNEASTKERQRLAGVTKDKLEQAITDWIEGTKEKKGMLEVLNQDFSKAKDFDAQKTQRWRSTLNQFLKHLGIEDITSATKDDIRQKIYDRYFKGEKKKSDLYQFVSDILTSSNNDFAAIKNNLDVYQWFAKMFGIKSQDLVTHLAVAEAEYQHDPDSVIYKANEPTKNKDEKGQPIERRNDLNTSEKDVLRFVWEEGRTAIQSTEEKKEEELVEETKPEKTLREVIAELEISRENKLTTEILREMKDYFEDQGIEYPSKSGEIYKFLVHQKPESLSEEDNKKVVKVVKPALKKWQELLKDSEYRARFLHELVNKFGDGINIETTEKAINFYIRYNVDRINVLEDIWKLYNSSEIGFLGVDKLGIALTLNDLSPIHFQKDGSFIHFRPHYLTGEKAPSDGRLYFNPDSTSIDQVIEILLEYSEKLQEKGMPGLRFKFIDVGDSDTHSRFERILVYFSREQQRDLLLMTKRITEDHQDWFQNRKVPYFTLPLAEGVGLAEDPLDKVGEKFYKDEEKKSFNEVRAQILKDSFLYLAIEEILRDLEGQKTIKFISPDGKEYSITDAINHIREKRSPYFRSEIDESIQKLKEYGMARFRGRPMTNFETFCEEIYGRTWGKMSSLGVDLFKEIFNNTNEDELIEYLIPIFEQVCRYYLVDPNNLALNP